PPGLRGAGPGPPAHGPGAAPRRRGRRRRPRRPGPGQAAHHPAALTVRRRPAHRGRGRAAPADRAGVRVPRPARRRPARLRLRRLVGGGRLGRLGTPARARPAALARTRHPAPGAGRPAPRPARPGRLRHALPGPCPPPLAGLPPGQVPLPCFAGPFRALPSHRWPSILAAADPAEWRQALWSTALAPLAMLGAIDIPARMSPSPAWFALTVTAPALVAAGAASRRPAPPGPL